MLRSYQGLTGLKTGYISQAGYCISASAEREGLSLVAVVMAAPTKENRMADAAALLNYGFANFCAYTPPEGLLKPVPVALGTAESVMPQMQGESSIVVEKAQLEGLETRIDLPETLTAPVEAGQEIGTLSIVSGETVLHTVPLTASESVAAQGMGALLLSFWQALMGGAPNITN